MLAAREDLVNQVIEIANKSGFTLYALTNEALQMVVEAGRMELSLSKIMERCRILEAAKRAGFVLVPEILFYQVLERVHKEREWTTKVCTESGEWFGKYYCLRNSKVNVDDFITDIRNFLWNVEKFNVTIEKGRELSINCVGSRFPESYAFFLGAFLEGAFNVLGYKCTRKNIAKGFVDLKFERGQKIEETR